MKELTKTVLSSRSRCILVILQACTSGTITFLPTVPVSIKQFILGLNVHLFRVAVFESHSENLSHCILLLFQWYSSTLGLGAILLLRPHKIRFLTPPSVPHASTWAGPPPPCGCPHAVDMKYTSLS